jgi:hypothetical protein
MTIYLFWIFILVKINVKNCKLEEMLVFRKLIYRLKGLSGNIVIYLFYLDLSSEMHQKLKNELIIAMKFHNL